MVKGLMKRYTDAHHTQVIYVVGDLCGPNTYENFLMSEEWNTDAIVT